MKKFLFLTSIIIVCVFVFGSAKTAKTINAESPKLELRTNFDQIRETSFGNLITKARQSGNIRVIVGLNTGFQPDGKLSEFEKFDQRTRIKTAQNNFLNYYQTFRGGEVTKFEYIPFLAMEVDEMTLRTMRTDANVQSIEEDIIGDAALAESTAIVGAPAAWNSGFTGSGQTIAVLDSGVDKNHGFLTGKVISEACYSSNISGSSTSVCPNGATQSTASNSGFNCPVSVEGCAHGTNVAGIAAGTNSSFSGVAKGANIIAVQMFSQFTCNGSPCARYWTSDLIKGLERVRTLADTMNNIAAVNLSLQTGQQFTNDCNSAHAATKAAIDNLRSVNIPTIICSGNFSFTNALTAPACISSAVSVGSTDDGSSGTAFDKVSSFSDSSPLLHLLAPGRWINSSIPGNLYQNYSGTSMAAPHVAGAFAVLRQKKPSATIDEILNALIASGDPILDTRNNITKPRLRVDKALTAISNNKTKFDFDGDAKADIAVFRPSNGSWYISNSSNNSFFATAFGATTDTVIPADFDGDGKTDVAVFRPSNGAWYWLNSSNGSFSGITFGQTGDYPIPADFDGDGKADIAVYRPSNGGWYILNSSNNQFVGIRFGVAEDKPTIGDFDGDGKADIAVFRPSTGSWYRLNSSNGAFFGTAFGTAEDKPTPADFDGDGKTDISVFRPSTGSWYRLNSSNGAFAGVTFGATTDKPTAADFDGDGRADIAVYRPSNGAWYRLNSANGAFVGTTFGVAEDIPIPNAFVK